MQLYGDLSSSNTQIKETNNKINMKKIFYLLLMAVLLSGSSVALARQHHQAARTAAVSDSVEEEENSNYMPEFTDTVDTVSNNRYSDADNDSLEFVGMRLFEKTSPFIFFLVCATFFCIFVLPVVVVFLIFYFRYKNKQAKFRLAEKALMAGKPLPEGVLASNEVKNIKYHRIPEVRVMERDKSIHYIFIGIGLFIFLWAFFNFAMGCIGILVMCYGLGQWFIAREHEKDLINSAPSASERPKETEKPRDTKDTEEEKNEEKTNVSEEDTQK